MIQTARVLVHPTVISQAASAASEKKEANCEIPTERRDRNLYVSGIAADYRGGVSLGSVRVCGVQSSSVHQLVGIFYFFPIMAK